RGIRAERGGGWSGAAMRRVRGLTRMSHSLFNATSRERPGRALKVFLHSRSVYRSARLPNRSAEKCRRTHRAPSGVTFCRFPGRRRCPTACCRPWTRRPSLIAHCGPEIPKLAKSRHDGIKTIFKTTSPVIIYTATGTGAWEAALVNTLSPGDRVLMVETGQFATLWKVMAQKIGLKPEFIPG